MGPFLALMALAVSLVLAACGDDDGSATAAADGAETVSVESVGDFEDVLVSPDGAALYTPDQEASGEILCTGSCTSIWVPIVVQNGQDLRGPPEIDAGLGTVKRPDGTTQVTFDGAPLYSFSEETPGQVTGDGFEDAFGGQQFTWHVVTANGGSSDSRGEPGSDSTGTGSSGGYGY
jgi:predicted lipoprotein with Yx(FWY)xxD motif